MILEQLHNEVLQKIGRNVLAYQKLEFMLKDIIAHSKIDGPTDRITDIYKRQIQEVKRKTLGQLVKPYLNTISTRPVDWNEGRPQDEWVWIRFVQGLSADAIDSIRVVLTELVSERNSLIHTMLAEYDEDNADNCVELIAALDQQYSFLAPQVDTIRAIHKYLDSMRAEIHAQVYGVS